MVNPERNMKVYTIWLLLMGSVSMVCISCSRIPEEDRLTIEIHSDYANQQEDTEDELVNLAVVPRKTNGPLLTIKADDIRPAYLIEQLFPLLGLTLDSMPSEIENARVTVSLQEVEWQPALEVILDTIDMAYVEKDQKITVMLKEDYMALPPEEIVYHITHDDLDKAMQFAVNLLVKNPVLEVHPDYTNHSIAVVAHISNQPEVKDTINRVNAIDDIPIFPDVSWPTDLQEDLPSVELRHTQVRADGLIMYTYHSLHIEVSRLALRLRQEVLLNENELIKECPLPNTLIVIAEPENAKQIASLCQYLDDERWRTERNVINE